MGFEYDGTDGEVVARRQDSPRRFVEITYRVRVVTDEPERRVELVHQNLRNYGTVFTPLPRCATCTAAGRQSP